MLPTGYARNLARLHSGLFGGPTVSARPYRAGTGRRWLRHRQGLIGATVLLTANLVLAYAVFRSRSFQRFVTGEPRILIRDGVPQKHALAAQRLTEQDLLAAVHNQGLEDFNRVHLGISEPNGTISVIPMRE